MSDRKASSVSLSVFKVTLRKSGAVLLLTARKISPVDSCRAMTSPLRGHRDIFVEAEQLFSCVEFPSKTHRQHCSHRRRCKDVTAHRRREHPLTHIPRMCRLVTTASPYSHEQARLMCALSTERNDNQDGGDKKLSIKKCANWADVTRALGSPLTVELPPLATGVQFYDGTTLHRPILH